MSELSKGAASGGDSGAGNQGGGSAGGAAGAGDAGAAGAGGQQGASGGADGGNSWLNSLSPEYREAAEIKGYKSADELAKAYVHAQKLIGADKIVVPGKTSTDEDWNNVWAKLGRPESPEKYEFKLGEGHKDEDVKGFKEHAHKLGLLPRQAEALYQFDLDRQKQSQEAMQAKRSEMIQNNLNGLKKEWGSNYDDQLKQAAAATEGFFGKEFLEWAEKCGVGDDPMFIKMMHKVSTQMTEDTLKGAGGVSFGESKASIQSKIDAVMGNMSHPYWDGAHPGHKGARDEMEGLYQQLNRAK